MSEREAMAKMEDSGRVDQIMRIDTTALLNIIKDLEFKLSDHHRQVEGNRRTKLLAARDINDSTDITSPYVILLHFTQYHLLLLIFCCIPDLYHLFLSLVPILVLILYFISFPFISLG